VALAETISSSQTLEINRSGSTRQCHGGLNVNNPENEFYVRDGFVSVLSTEDNKGWAFVDKLYVQNGVREDLTPIEGEEGSWNLGTPGTQWGTLYVNNVEESSDRRLKTDIEDLDGGLETLLDLRPVSYSLKSNGSETHLGLIGQEVAEVLPEIVNKPEDDDGYLGLNYTQLVAVLIDAIQTQHDEQERLEERVDRQQDRIDDQQERIDDLEERLAALEHST